MAQCQGPHAHKRLFLIFTVLYLAGRYWKNLKVSGVELNVNPAWAIAWLVGVTIYCTFFNNNSPPPGQFLCNKILLKKIATVRGMLIEQIFELRGPGPPGRICTLITGCFHDKTINSEENFQVHCYSRQKYCMRHCAVLSSPPGPSHLQNLTLKCKILNVFWT